jgi:hypothetical protein
MPSLTEYNRRELDAKATQAVVGDLMPSWYFDPDSIMTADDLTYEVRTPGKHLVQHWQRTDTGEWRLQSCRSI